MKKKIVIGIVVFVMLVLLIPIRLQMKDGGSIQYKAVLYSVTKYHQITLKEGSEDNGIVESGYRVGWRFEVLGLEIFNNVRFVSDNNSEKEEVDIETDSLVDLTDASSLEVARNNQEYCNAKVLEIYEDCFLAECLDVTSGLLKTGTKVMVTKNIVAAAGVPELNAGDHIRIVYNGLKRTKTEEMKIVYAIYHLNEEGEIISQ